MRRNARRFAAAAIVVLAIGVPALLVWRTLPPQTEWQVVAADSGTRMPVELAADGGTRSLTVDTPRFPSVSDARVEVIVATYGRAPSRTIRLDLRDASGKTLRSCRIAPADYRDNGPVACPVDRPDRVRHVEVTVPRDVRFGLYAVNGGGKLVAGSLLQRHHFEGLGARLAAVRERVGVSRPALASPIVLVVCLAASIALLGAGLLLAFDRE